MAVDPILCLESTIGKWKDDETGRIYCVDLGPLLDTEEWLQQLDLPLDSDDGEVPVFQDESFGQNACSNATDLTHSRDEHPAAVSTCAGTSRFGTKASCHTELESLPSEANGGLSFHEEDCESVCSAIDAKEVQLLGLVGMGHSVAVFKGQSGSQMVAVKQLKSCKTTQEGRELA